MSLLEPRLSYKPFQYDWAYQAWEIQQKIHWLPEEIPMADDVQDWHHKICGTEKNLLTQIFRFFTQADVEVHDCYMRHYAGVFKPPEVCMMLTAFANMETIHIAAYAHLLDTVGMPETEYLAFTKYKQMKEKCEYLKAFKMDNPTEIAKTLAVYGAFTEGLQLFASFAILLNFPRFNKMKGMGQIIAYSVRDETLHSNSITKLFRTFLLENNIDKFKLEAEIREICNAMVHHEDAFIDLAFEMGDVEGLKASEVKEYIRYIANLRLKQLGFSEIYEQKVNPLLWLEAVLNTVEHTNFFENKATEYSKAATKGTWDEAFNFSDA
ncbi:ribonucleotide-diphosphate reductase subunit beta [Neorickettsia sennetsu]|uniref:Ribonucleoside-diphosphate reductase subunit beta n=1 Tax=Ehrlichia sennetsu (strain ATCC VR-367 / Miyayama) TaxID=222891 RepID=Q2GDP2_EHRS3|nr:ribonucleotide-diphosphate reductase subunit beta [Neorickettsia sennetsu]ABD46362.1 ribonucleoside-diphosphate reductase, beta subunit [Neorickettsia sennetsu str. Miyayama]